MIYGELFKSGEVVNEIIISRSFIIFFKKGAFNCRNKPLNGSPFFEARLNFRNMWLRLRKNESPFFKM